MDTTRTERSKKFQIRGYDSGSETPDAWGTWVNLGEYAYMPHALAEAERIIALTTHWTRIVVVQIRVVEEETILANIPTNVEPAL